MTPRKHLNHDAPHWVNADADYFITLCAEPRGHNHFCHPDLGAVVLDSIRIDNDQHHWYCELAVLMPDHLHLVVHFPPEKTVAQVTGLWKHALARSHGITWQRNFFDHRLRNDENAQQKWDYVLLNPVRAGLIDDASKWPYTWMPNH